MKFALSLSCLVTGYLIARACSSTAEEYHADSLEHSIRALTVDNSWIRELDADPGQEQHAPNRSPRNVDQGHFVLVAPTPLANPVLVLHTPEILHGLGLNASSASSESVFTAVFSGDLSLGPFKPTETWATPYALSIYGQEHLPQGAGPDGHGYGDGRAISIAEVISTGAVDGNWPLNPRVELQLKGAGRTPFCRGADGRAVLRSSVREFLASEAMHHLGVPATRALSLVASSTDKVSRPWYLKPDPSGKKSSALSSDHKHGGDMMQEEPTAITTRVASSFLRVGHFQLFARRAERARRRGFERRSAEAKRQLGLLVQHALRREIILGGSREPETPSSNMMPQVGDVLRLAKGAYQGLAFAGADWIRVGYVQSNFNSDNCHITGLALDFGPFGFVDRYDPEWGMWIGSGKHFAFMNQARAAGRNFASLVEALEVLFSGGGNNDENMAIGTEAERAAGLRELRKLVSSFDDYSSHILQMIIQAKMGLGPLPVSPAMTTSDNGTTSTTTTTTTTTTKTVVFVDSTMGSTTTPRDGAVHFLWEELERLMFEGRVDWTIFWRQLAYAAEGMGCPQNNDEVQGFAAESALLKLRKSFFPEEEVENVAEDSHIECHSWALKGECAQNPVYMRAECAQACRALSRARFRSRADLTGSEESKLVGGALRTDWLAWIRRWQAFCPDSEVMKRASPKFVPREWMLVKAYEEAQKDLVQLKPGDSGRDSFAELRRLQQVFSAPYEEQSDEMTKRYYRLPPLGSERQGGVGFMS